MFDISGLLKISPYSYDAAAKSELLVGALSELTRSHYEHCPEYRKILDLLGHKPEPARRIEDVPFIPVRLFKEFDLRSVDERDVFKTMTSSGTTGQAVSRIFLDRATAAAQTRVLVKIVSDFTGGRRLPFLVVDSPSVVKDRRLFSARGAGVVGFSMLGYDTTYLLDEKWQIDFDGLSEFLERHSSEKILLFGFTFIVWKHLCRALEETGRRLSLNGVLIHGGGWKKLASVAVDNSVFKKTLQEMTGISTVHNYYGMVEQTGSIFMECEEGHLHASIFSDILIRDPADFSSTGPGRKGLVQLVSLLPASYPGHSILTEDIGEIVGTDDCRCGRKGTYFQIHGRVEKAELRGCSDVYASAT